MQSPPIPPDCSRTAGERETGGSSWYSRRAGDQGLAGEPRPTVERHPTGSGRPRVRSRTAAGEAGARLRHEASVLTRARHPGVVELTSAVTVGGHVTVVTAVPAGPRLGQAVLSLEEVAGVSAVVATTVADLHDIGIAHARVGPEPVVLADDGRPVLDGFEDSRWLDGPPARWPQHPLARADDRALGLLIEGLLAACAPIEVLRILDRPARRSRLWLPSGPAGRRGSRADRGTAATLAHWAARATEGRASARELAAALAAEVSGAKLPAVAVRPGLGTEPLRNTAPALAAGGLPATDLTDEAIEAWLAEGPAPTAGADIEDGDAPAHGDAEPAPGSDPPGCDQPPGSASAAAPPTSVPAGAPPAVWLRRGPLAAVMALGAVAVAIVTVAVAGPSRPHVLTDRRPSSAVGDRPGDRPRPSLAGVAGGTRRAVPPSSPAPASPAGAGRPFPVTGAAPPPCLPTGSRTGATCTAAMTYVDGVVSVGTARFAVGEPGDVIATGRWQCGPIPTIVVLRPSTGQLWAFDTWPMGDTPVTATLVGTTPGGRTVRPEDVGECDSALVGRQDGTTVEIRPWDHGSTP